MTAVPCEDIRDLLDAAALDALDEPDASAVAAHVEGCVACRAALDRAREAAAAIGLSAPLLRLPASGRERVLAGVRGERASPGRWWPLVAAASLLLAAGLGVWAISLQAQVHRLRQDLAAAPTEADVAAVFAMALDPAVQAVSLEPVDADGGAQARYVWRKDGLGLLVVDHLPAIGDDEVFALWFVEDGDARLAGTFHPYEGRGWLLVEDPPGPWDELRVSVEPADAVRGSGRLVLATAP